MAKKFNLSDAAKAILVNEDAKSNFDANIAAKRGQRGQDTHPHGEVGAQKIKSSTAYGTNDAGIIGHSPRKIDDPLPDYLKGTPSAKPPGATPPVGAQQDGVGASRPKNQPQETMGRSDVMHPDSQDPMSYENKRDRVKYTAPKQTFTKNANAHFDTYGEETEVEYDESIEEGHEDEAQDKALIKKEIQKEKMKEKMKEDIDALLSGENLSEEFVAKATTIFESAVIARAAEVIEEAEAELTVQFEAALEQVKEDLAVKVDDYLNYMVEEWMKENELAIEKGLRSEITEDFINGLKDLFTEHYIDIPEEKVDIVEELAEKCNELENSLNEEINYNVELKKALTEQMKIEAIYTACEGLTQTQVEKLKSLAESIEFTTDGEFNNKLATLKESYFQVSVKVADKLALDEEVDIDEGKKTTFSDKSIEQYSQMISKTVLK